MKSFLIAFVFLGLSVAQAEVVVLEGRTTAGEPCQLILENWQEGAATWREMNLQVRTSWQRSEHPAIAVSPSFTPGSLYGFNRQTRDQVAVNCDMGAPALEKIISYNFQSAVDGLFQAYCRIRLPSQP